MTSAKDVADKLARPKAEPQPTRTDYSLRWDRATLRLLSASTDAQWIGAGKELAGLLRERNGRVTE